MAGQQIVGLKSASRGLTAVSAVALLLGLVSCAVQGTFEERAFIIQDGSRFESRPDGVAGEIDGAGASMREGNRHSIDSGNTERPTGPTPNASPFGACHLR